MLPIVLMRSISGANGRNWPGFVLLDPAAPFPAAVLAQEAWEAMFKVWLYRVVRLVPQPLGATRARGHGP